MMNKYDEKGSPCRRPLLHWIQDPGFLFRRIAVLPVCRMFLTQAQKIGGKPLACKIDMREDQQMESKAFLKSSLKTIVGLLREWQELMRSAAKTKFSGDVSTRNEACLIAMNQHRDERFQARSGNFCNSFYQAVLQRDGSKSVRGGRCILLREENNMGTVQTFFVSSTLVEMREEGQNKGFH